VAKVENHYLFIIFLTQIQQERVQCVQRGRSEKSYAGLQDEVVGAAGPVLAHRVRRGLRRYKNNFVFIKFNTFF
jgi:hypothetical protein